MRFYTNRRGRRRPITSRRYRPYYVRSTPPRRSSFSYQHYPPPLPENIIRPKFILPENTKRQIADGILDYVAEKAGDGVAKALAPTLMHLIPSTLGVNVQHVIKIEQERRAVKGYVGISIPIDLSKLPGGIVVQTVAGTPTFYTNIQSRVRLYKTKRAVQTTEVSVGYSQKPAWAEQGVTVGWRKSFKPISLKLPVPA